MAQSNEDPAGANRGANTNSTSNDEAHSNGGTHSSGNGGAQGQYTSAPKEEPFDPLKWDETEPTEPGHTNPDDGKEGNEEAPGPGPFSDPPPLPDGWPRLHPDALHGIAGDYVRIVAPRTEAPPVGLLTHFLTCFGNAVGRTAWVFGDGRHYPVLFTMLAGPTARGRKGTAEGHIRRLYEIADHRASLEPVTPRRRQWALFSAAERRFLYCPR
jgi:hypothetical protein